MIAEVYPSIFRNRYDKQGRTAVIAFPARAVGDQHYRMSACFADAQHQRRPGLGTRPGNTVLREPAPYNVADLWWLEPAGGGLRHQNRLVLTFMRPGGCSRSIVFFCFAVSGPSSGS